MGELVASGVEMPPPLPLGSVELPPLSSIPRRVGAETGCVPSWKPHPFDRTDSEEEVRRPKKNLKDRRRSSWALGVDDSMASESDLCLP